MLLSLCCTKYVFGVLWKENISLSIHFLFHKIKLSKIAFFLLPNYVSNHYSYNKTAKKVHTIYNQFIKISFLETLLLEDLLMDKVHIQT